MADDVRPLKEPETIGRALTPEQKSALLETAAIKPEWQTAFYAAQSALQTGMRGCEIRGLRWSNVDLLADTLTIRKSKTAAGVRTIPLTRGAFETFDELHKRAELFGDVLGEHYVFARFKPVGRFEGRELQKCVWLDSIQRNPSVAGKRCGAHSQQRQDCPDCAFTIYGIT
jgi:integrase